MSNKTFIIISIIFLISLLRLSYLIIIKGDYYGEELIKKSEKTILINDEPRGRILDRNGKVLVDNIGVKKIVFTNSNYSITEKLNIASSLANCISLNEVPSILELKKYWLLINEDEGNSLITKDEMIKVEKRLITTDVIYDLKIKRITNKMLESFDAKERLIALIFSKMEKDYSFKVKIIKDSDVSDSEVISITNANIEGISIKMYWDRYYPYGETLRSIYGNVSSNGIPSDLKEYYDDSYYSMDDRVGISYLELYYDRYLQGKKSVYKIKNNSLELNEKGKKGNDLVLNIDIDLVLEIENILKEEMLKTKKEKNTKYFNHSYIILSDPNNGQIIVPLSLKLINGNFIDNSINMINNSYTLGSVIKGASSTVNYLYELIEEDRLILDSCIKLYLVPEKCSHRPLGKINDITALAYSSNYYQYLTAIYLTGNNYSRNMELNVSKHNFDVYRAIFKSYGLGIKTEIDLPHEKTGIIGKNYAADLLLNLAIGQYDAYTPIQLVQYINTIASGKRIAPSLANKINGDDSEKNIKVKVLNDVLINENKLNRIRLGFRKVFEIGTARNYTIKEVVGAGKTGTSETFIDTNLDGINDTSTITTSVAMYLPASMPKYSLVIISPDISYDNKQSAHVSYINKRLARRITELLLEKGL